MQRGNVYINTEPVILSKLQEGRIQKAAMVGDNFQVVGLGPFSVPRVEEICLVHSKTNMAIYISRDDLLSKFTYQKDSPTVENTPPEPNIYIEYPACTVIDNREDLSAIFIIIVMVITAMIILGSIAVFVPKALEKL